VNAAVIWLKLMANYFLQNNDWSCDSLSGRCFFEFPYALCRQSTEKHILLVDELKDPQFRDLSDPWIFSFSYMSYDFFVESNSHGTATTFIVTHPKCPDEILLQVIGIFSEPIKIASGHEPIRPELYKSPARENRRNFFLRWGIRIVAIALLGLAINSFFNGNHETGTGFVGSAIFLLVVSICADFAPHSTY
jgi:hypothetical protein